MQGSEFESPAPHPADLLLDAVDRCDSPICVGLDPVAERLPTALRPEGGATNNVIVDRLAAFCIRVLTSLEGVVPCIKVQSACFERYRGAGQAALDDVINEAVQRGFVVILDAKRGDIGLTAQHYAAAAFPTDRRAPHWVTASAYLGSDALSPFLQRGGVCALVRTSNPSAAAIQDARLADGTTVAEHVAGYLDEFGRTVLGRRGYSAVGAVVGATEAGAIPALRARMPHQIFLVPGYGAQGGGPEDVRACFHGDGTGALITASRSVIYAFDPDDLHWERRVATAARDMADAVRQVLTTGA